MAVAVAAAATGTLPVLLKITRPSKRSFHDQPTNSAKKFAVTNRFMYCLKTKFCLPIHAHTLHNDKSLQTWSRLKVGDFKAQSAARQTD